MAKARASKLIGRKVEIRDGYYAGHWGVITGYSGHGYYVSGGSIGAMAPLLSRDELKVKRAARKEQTK